MFLKDFEKFLLEREDDGFELEYPAPSSYSQRFSFWLEYNLNKLSVKTVTFKLVKGELLVSNLSYYNDGDPVTYFPFNIEFENNENHPWRIRNITFKI